MEVEFVWESFKFGNGEVHMLVPMELKESVELVAHMLGPSRGVFIGERYVVSLDGAAALLDLASYLGIDLLDVVDADRRGAAAVLAMLASNDRYVRIIGGGADMLPRVEFEREPRILGDVEYSDGPTFDRGKCKLSCQCVARYWANLGVARLLELDVYVDTGRWNETVLAEW